MKLLRRNGAPMGPRKTSSSSSAGNSARCRFIASTSIAGRATTRRPAADFGGPATRRPSRSSANFREILTVPASRSRSQRRTATSSPHRTPVNAANNTSARNLGRPARTRRSPAESCPPAAQDLPPCRIRESDTDSPQSVDPPSPQYSEPHVAVGTTSPRPSPTAPPRVAVAASFGSSAE